MVGWHHWLDGHKSEQVPAVGEGQGNLVCCSPWGQKESDMTEQLNWTEPFQESNGASRGKKKRRKIWKLEYNPTLGICGSQ